MGIVIHVFVSALLLWTVGQLVSGIEVRDGKAALFGAVGLGLANAVVRPVLLMLALPITFLTLGLFAFVVNALMLMLASAFVDGFEVKGFGSAMWGALILWGMNLLAGMLLPFLF
jgi:putative membrane protein